MSPFVLGETYISRISIPSCHHGNHVYNASQKCWPAGSEVRKHVCRASLPVVTAAVAVLVEKKVPSREECGALILLTMGVTVTVFEGKATGSGAGLFLCVAGQSPSGLQIQDL